MARIFIDGFESGSLDLWDLRNDNPTVATGISGMDGVYCANLNNSQRYIRINLPSAVGQLYASMRYRPMLSTSSYGIMSFFNAGTALLHVVRLSPSAIAIYRGSTQITSTTVNFPDNVTYLIETYYLPATSNGVVIVKMNGLGVINFTGQTTPGATTITRWGAGYNDMTLNNSANCYVDNIVLDDADWIGPARIAGLRPSSSGSSTQWTASSGQNWDTVDEVPPSDADYNYCVQNGLVDLFTFSDLSGQIEAIKCVQVQARALIQGNPIVNKLQLGVRSGSNNYFSNSKNVSTSPIGVWHLWRTDPATSEDWTVNGVNNAEFGYKSSAT